MQPQLRQYQANLDKPTNKQAIKQTHKQTNKQTNEQTNEQTHEQTNSSLGGGAPPTTSCALRGFECLVNSMTLNQLQNSRDYRFVIEK